VAERHCTFVKGGDGYGGEPKHPGSCNSRHRWAIDRRKRQAGHSPAWRPHRQRSHAATSATVHSPDSLLGSRRGRVTRWPPTRSPDDGAVVLAGPLRGRQRATTLLPNSSRKLCGSQYRGCGLTDGLFQLADCLRSVADVEFVEDALQVVLHGEAADTENHPDF
jgi:hypothetical protein